jgi:hypothetical protein
MALMLSKLYDALREAGASDLKAREAAEEAAAFENRFDLIERHLEHLDGRLSLVQCMLGVNLVVLLGVFCRVFSQT